MFDTYAVIDRATDTEERDSEFGMKTKPANYDPVWEGFGSKQSGRYQIARLQMTGERVDANGIFLMPPGDHGVRIGDRIRLGSREGEVKLVNTDTEQFYTRLFVLWHTLNRSQ